MTPLLAMAGVACWRGGRWLFTDVDLTLRPGEAIHLSGPNGCGKSSLMRIAAGLLRPAAGTVHRAALALADDALALDRERPLGMALGFWAGLDRAGDRLDPALAAMGIAHLGDVPVRMLSTGQARRARIARVIAANVPLWLLDEPLNGLDADGRASLAAAVATHLAGGGAVLAASHVPLGPGFVERRLAA